MWSSIGLVCHWSWGVNKSRGTEERIDGLMDRGVAGRMEEVSGHNFSNSWPGAVRPS